MGKYNKRFKNQSNKTALHIHAEEGHNDMLEHILEYGQNTGGFVKDSDGTISSLNIWHTSLYLIGCITYPLTLGYVGLTDFVYLDLKDDFGNTPLHYAAKSGNLEAIELLKAYGANLNATNNNDLTPMMSALNEDNYKPAVKLLQLGAKLNSKLDMQKKPFVQDLLINRDEYKCGTRTVEDWKNQQEDKKNQEKAVSTWFTKKEDKVVEEKKKIVEENVIEYPKETQEPLYTKNDQYESSSEETFGNGVDLTEAEEAFEQSQKIESWFE